MPKTKDWRLLGRTTWLCEIYGGDENDPHSKVFKVAELISKDQAVRWVKRHLPRYAAATTFDTRASIQSGIWEDDSFKDVDYGLVRDAIWNCEGKPYACAWLSDRRSGFVIIEWYED